jgi:glycosyltransferase involved in cell wall biosynthesis
MVRGRLKLMQAKPAHNVAVVTNSASERWGGEALYAIQYFRRLRARGIQAHLICHDRTKEELSTLFADCMEFVHFTPTSQRQVWADRLGSKLPKRLLVPHVISWDVHRQAAAIIRKLVRSHGVNIALQPAPISPKFPSALFGCDVPVVIGPMNGAMKYPQGFGKVESGFTHASVTLARSAGAIMNRIIPGKRKAAALIVSNQRTHDALPVHHPHVHYIFDAAVDCAEFPFVDRTQRTGEPTFVFVGRFERWKGPDLAVRAWKLLRDQGRRAKLKLIGDGDLRGELETLVDQSGLRDWVSFTGFLPQKQVATELEQADGFVFPSYWEAGGAVVLEAMASGLPCVVLNWGGPAEYVDAQSGVLIEPHHKDQVVEDLAKAVGQLIDRPDLRHSLGQAAFVKAQEFDWSHKIDRLIEIFDQVRSDAN